MHNLACARRLDYAHVGKFMCAPELAQKPNFIYLFLFLLSHVCFCIAYFPYFHSFKTSISHVCLVFCCFNAMNVYSHAHA